MLFRSKHSTGFFGSLVSGVFTPIKRTVSLGLRSSVSPSITLMTLLTSLWTDVGVSVKTQDEMARIRKTAKTVAFEITSYEKANRVPDGS